MTLEYLVRDYVQGEIQFEFVKQWTKEQIRHLPFDQQARILAELERLKQMKDDVEMCQRMASLFQMNNINDYPTSRRK